MSSVKNTPLSSKKSNLPCTPTSMKKKETPSSLLIENQALAEELVHLKLLLQETQNKHDTEKQVCNEMISSLQKQNAVTNDLLSAERKQVLSLQKKLAVSEADREKIKTCFSTHLREKCGKASPIAQSYRELLDKFEESNALCCRYRDMIEQMRNDELKRRQITITDDEEEPNSVASSSSDEGEDLAELYSLRSNPKLMEKVTVKHLRQQLKRWCVTDIPKSAKKEKYAEMIFNYLDSLPDGESPVKLQANHLTFVPTPSKMNSKR